MKKNTINSFLIIFSIFLNLFPSFSFAENKTKGNPQSIELNEQGVKLVNKKDFLGAEDTFRKALAVDKMNITAAFNLASVYLQNNKSNEAITLLSSYVSQYPKDAGLYARLGDAYFAAKRITLAKPQYEKTLTINPNYPGISSKLATIYSMENDLEKAEGMFLKAVSEEPKNGQLLANLSSVFLAQQKAEDAVSVAKRALQVSPSSEVYITLGSAYRELKDYDNALIAFQRAKDLGDNRPELDQLIQEVKKIKKDLS